MREIVGILLLMAWMGGIVLAKGFWLTALSIFLPFYAWYLLAERIMSHAGII